MSNKLIKTFDIGSKNMIDIGSKNMIDTLSNSNEDNKLDFYPEYFNIEYINKKNNYEYTDTDEDEDKDKVELKKKNYFLTIL